MKFDIDTVLKPFLNDMKTILTGRDETRRDETKKVKLTKNQLIDFRSGPKLGDIKLTAPNCIKAAKAFIYRSLDARTAAADGRTDGRTVFQLRR